MCVFHLHHVRAALTFLKRLFAFDASLFVIWVLVFGSLVTSGSAFGQMIIPTTSVLPPSMPTTSLILGDDLSAFQDPKGEWFATGYAAALCKKHDATPRDVGQRHITELRRLIGYETDST